MAALLWTFPLLMFASIVIGWAAELTAARLSAGIALAILAWLQCAPEFAVEASIAMEQNASLALANLTGSLRLLIGLGWPMVFLIHWAAKRREKVKISEIVLPESFSIEALGMAVPLVYFFFIYLKGTWSFYDGLVLVAFYGVYFFLLNYKRKKDPDVDFEEVVEGEPWIVKKIHEFPRGVQTLCLIGLFAGGGGILLLTAHPFVNSLQAVAGALGVSQYIFVQWVAPIASEFPEKVTAFNWARKPGRAPMAVINMLSSVTSQWTLLAGLVPLIFSLSAKRLYVIEFTDFQSTELLLTIVQSGLVVALLADLKIKHVEVLGLFILWLAQFIMPNTHFYLVPIYMVWAAFEFVRVLLSKNGFVPLHVFLKLLSAKKR